MYLHMLIRGRSGYWSVAAIGGAVLCAVAGLVWLYVSDPSVEMRWLPQCLFERYTGLYCPGCGTTRSLHAMLHLRPLAALKYNLILYPALALVALLIVRPELALRRSVSYSVLIAVVLFWIGRNLPWYPFYLLAP